MSINTTVEIIEEEKQTLNEDLQLLAKSFELELEKDLMPLKAAALKEGLKQSIELKRLEAENEILRIKSATAKRIDDLKTERVRLELENATPEQKAIARKLAREAHEKRLDSIRKKYDV